MPEERLGEKGRITEFIEVTRIGSVERMHADDEEAEKELPWRSLGREVLEDWSLGAEGKLREQEIRE